MQAAAFFERQNSTSKAVKMRTARLGRNPAKLRHR
jgi:hypothetical protein